MAEPRVDRQQNQNKQQKKKGLGGWLWVILIFLIPNLVEALEDSDLWWNLRWGLNRLFHGAGPMNTAIVGMVVLGAVFVILALILLRVILSALRRKSGENDTASFAREGRVSAAVNRPDPRSKSFQQPDPYCVVCDHTGEDHFEHDRKRRLQQLNEWLKNGLIDREEYKVLRYRYERDL